MKFFKKLDFNVWDIAYEYDLSETFAVGGMNYTCMCQTAIFVATEREYIIASCVTYRNLSVYIMSLV